VAAFRGKLVQGAVIDRHLWGALRPRNHNWAAAEGRHGRPFSLGWITLDHCGRCRGPCRAGFGGFPPVFFLQVVVDGDGGGGALGGGDDDELHIAVGIAGEEEAGDGGALAGVGAGGAGVIDSAAEMLGEVGSLHLFSVEEESVALDGRA
jgi:hypothetical protein